VPTSGQNYQIFWMKSFIFLLYILIALFQTSSEHYNFIHHYRPFYNKYYPRQDRKMIQLTKVRSIIVQPIKTRSTWFDLLCIPAWSGLLRIFWAYEPKRTNEPTTWLELLQCLLICGIVLFFIISYFELRYYCCIKHLIYLSFFNFLLY